jgi:hypothetical protein
MTCRKPESTEPAPAGTALPKTETAGGTPQRVLYSAALAEARRLKREHRAYYRADTEGFRTTVRKAHSRIFRMKPGPKPKRDPRIVQAARKRAGGASWPDLFPQFIDGYSTMTEFTRSYAEDGFKGKVNDYLRSHPVRKSTADIKQDNSDCSI